MMEELEELDDLAAGQVYAAEIPENYTVLKDASRQKIRQWLQDFHNVSGHPPNRVLTKYLERKKAEPAVMEEAAKFECPACAEERRGDARPPAAAGFPPGPWHTVGNDLFEWEHPINLAKSKMLHRCG